MTVASETDRAIDAEFRSWAVSQRPAQRPAQAERRRPRPAAASLRTLLAARRPGRPTVRVTEARGEDDREKTRETGGAVVQIVNDDMPFLVDSVTQALNARHLMVHLVIHPVMPVLRDQAGVLLRFGAQAPGAPAESVMHVELDGAVEPELVTELVQALETVLADVRIAVVDFPLMSAKADRIAQEIAHAPDARVGARRKRLPSSRGSNDRNFTFLGYREYRIEQDGVSIEPGSGLGLLRADSDLVFDGFRNQPAFSSAPGNSASPLAC